MGNEPDGVSLKYIISDLLRALIEARHLGDLETMRLSETYKDQKNLISFPVPAFSISDVDIELYFSIVGVSEKEDNKDEISDVMVSVSPESLKSLEPHHINLIKIKISPENIRVFEKE